MELKSVVADPDALRRQLQHAFGAPTFAGRMSDLRFDRKGRLGALDQVLRVRRYLPTHGPAREEIGWKGASSTTADGYKVREELEATLGGGVPIAEILIAIGFEPVHAIDRYVELFPVAAAVTRLEWYPACDTLVEVEGSPAAIEEAIGILGLPREGFAADPLSVFAAAWARRTGRPARLALDSPDERPDHWPS